LILLPGNKIQRKWRNIPYNFRKELQLQKEVVSGQGTRKRRKYIYFDQLLFLLTIMQERDTSGNITLPPSANESEPEDITTGNQTGEGLHVKNATSYRQQKTRSKTMYEESLLEIIKEESRDDIDEDKSFYCLWYRCSKS
jgi:hypothetical protein